MSSNPFRLAFVGGATDSAVGRVHVIASQMDSNFELVAGCFSLNPKVNKDSADEYGIAPDRLYSSPLELIDNEKAQIDALVVLTPTPLHKEVIVQALTNHIPVISEKALATSSAEAREIFDCLDKTDGFLTVTYNYTGYPMVRELKAMIQSGKLGHINQIQIEMPQEGFAKVNRDGEHPPPQSWRLKDAYIPTVSLDLGVHLVHMVGFLTAETPVELVASEDTFGHFNGIVDNVTSVIRYTNGLLCNMWYGKASLGYKNGLRVRVLGTEGTAEWYQMTPETLTVYDKYGTQIILDRSNKDLIEACSDRYERFKPGHPAGFIEAFANYYSDISTELKQSKPVKSSTGSYISGVEVSYAGLKVLEAIHESSVSKRWLSLEDICLK